MVLVARKETERDIGHYFSSPLQRGVQHLAVLVVCAAAVLYGRVEDPGTQGSSTRAATAVRRAAQSPTAGNSDLRDVCPGGGPSTLRCADALRWHRPTVAAALIEGPEIHVTIVENATSELAPAIPPTLVQTYVVDTGDSVSSLAERFGLLNETIVWANNLANPDVLTSGTELVIPVFDGVWHPVQPGDTLADLAVYYGADLDDAIKLNRLMPPYVIVVGDHLLIPGGKMPRAFAATFSTSDDTSGGDASLRADESVQQPPDEQIVQAAEATAPEPLPVPPSASEGQAAFILAIAPAARASQNLTGVPASVTIAQAILESHWGTSRLAREANNYFGIKATSRGGSAGVIWFNAWEHLGGQDVVRNEPFRAYVSLDDSFVDHGLLFFENARYGNAMAVADDPRAFARAIAAAGYATDPTYATKLIRLMERFNLYAYDVRPDQ